MNKSKSFIFAIIGIIVLLSVVQVIISTSLSTAGLDLVKLQNLQKYYAKENATLREKFLTASSYLYISEKAKSLGFVNEKAHIFLSSPLPLAVKP